uniref:Root cap n=1 Tax=Lotus japonicus TaxID=34305 RepID=I3SZI7_LOTJA|nr:unknown [Lotus japonicus]
MGVSRSIGLSTFVLLFAFFMMHVDAFYSDTQTCTNRKSRCFLKKIQCPHECPLKSPSNPKDKVCYLDCDSPMCKASCKSRKPNCNGRGSACLDPRFVGADGIVFYFHGRRDEHFSLVSDVNLQINARFIGLRPAGRPRDYTWIQALGILFDSHKFSVEATPSGIWDDEIDRLKISYDGSELDIPEGHLSTWQDQENQLRIERTSSKNSVLITLPEVAEISVNVVPVTKEDSRIHNYQIPDDDCFAHLEVQFKFYGLSSKVEGVLGRTYQPDFQNPAKPGVAMPVVGGEDKYRTTSLTFADCSVCMFSPAEAFEKEDSVMEYGVLDCTGGANSGNGIVCRR